MTSGDPAAAPPTAQKQPDGPGWRVEDGARKLACHVGIGRPVIGEALVASDDFSARYDLDRIQGVFSRPSHALAGQSYVDRILVLNTAKGGVASAWMLHEMASRALAPRAILFNRANTILAQGAALAGMTMVDRFEEGDVCGLIRTGDELFVDPVAGSVIVRARS